MSVRLSLSNKGKVIILVGLVLLSAGTGFAVWYLNNRETQVGDEDAAAGNGVTCHALTGATCTDDGSNPQCSTCNGEEECIPRGGGEYHCADPGNQGGETCEGTAKCDNSGCRCENGDNCDYDTASFKCSWPNNPSKNNIPVSCNDANADGGTADGTCQTIQYDVKRCNGTNANVVWIDGEGRRCSSNDGGLDWCISNGRIDLDTCDGQKQPASCDSVTGSLAQRTQAGLNQGLNFTVNSSGQDISKVELCFHGDFEGPGWSAGWKCYRDSTPGDGVYNFSDSDPSTSDISFSGNSFTFNEVVERLSTGNSGNDYSRQELLDGGLRWGVNVWQSHGICFSTGIYEGEGAEECQVAESCSGTLALVGPPTCSSLTSNQGSFREGDTITLTANVSDIDGEIADVEFHWATSTDGGDYCQDQIWNSIGKGVEQSNSVWNIDWVVEGVPEGESVVVAANVTDEDGNQCTGNPSGKCGTDMSACTACSLEISQIPPSCGDGECNNPNEQCEAVTLPGLGNSCLESGESVEVCREDCTYCGDGIVQESWGEECDADKPDCTKECKLKEAPVPDTGLFDTTRSKIIAAVSMLVLSFVYLKFDQFDSLSVNSINGVKGFGSSIKTAWRDRFGEDRKVDKSRKKFEDRVKSEDK